MHAAQSLWLFTVVPSLPLRDLIVNLVAAINVDWILLEIGQTATCMAATAATCKADGGRTPQDWVLHINATCGPPTSDQSAAQQRARLELLTAATEALAIEAHRNDAHLAELWLQRLLLQRKTRSIDDAAVTARFKALAEAGLAATYARFHCAWAAAECNTGGVQCHISCHVMSCDVSR
eukprot:jgi/Hompol1/2769/HPOL_001551-RA